MHRLAFGWVGCDQLGIIAASLSIFFLGLEEEVGTYMPHSSSPHMVLGYI